MSNPSVLLSAAALASVWLAAAPAMAEEIQCTGTIGAVALDNIFVPDGARCTLNRTRANGSVVVGTGASLVAKGVGIRGNVQAEGAHSLELRNSIVGGSVQFVQGGSATVARTRIVGDLYFDSNHGLIDASDNRIGSDLQAFQNVGGVNLIGNFIKGNLQCKENVPEPTGGGNQAALKQDQCEQL
jgi:hypothetical protein